MQFIIGNIIDPKISGDRLDLSPSFILLFLLICGFIWGVVGMFLAIPIMLFIKAVCDQIPAVANIGVLFSSGKKLPTPVRVNANEEDKNQASSKAKNKFDFKAIKSVGKVFASILTKLKIKTASANKNSSDNSSSGSGLADTNQE